MILSDRSIRGAIEAGRIGIDPYDPSLIQPAPAVDGSPAADEQCGGG